MYSFFVRNAQAPDGAAEFETVQELRTRLVAKYARQFFPAGAAGDLGLQGPERRAREQEQEQEQEHAGRKAVEVVSEGGMGLVPTQPQDRARGVAGRLLCGDGFQEWLSAAHPRHGAWPARNSRRLTRSSRHHWGAQENVDTDGGTVTVGGWHADTGRETETRDGDGRQRGGREMLLSDAKADAAAVSCFWRCAFFLGFPVSMQTSFGGKHAWDCLMLCVWCRQVRLQCAYRSALAREIVRSIILENMRLAEEYAAYEDEAMQRSTACDEPAALPDIFCAADSSGSAHMTGPASPVQHSKEAHFDLVLDYNFEGILNEQGYFAEVS